jgi:hypothetical protein
VSPLSNSQSRNLPASDELYALIGGWSSSDVGESYGEGLQLSDVNGWMNKLLLINNL